MTAGPATGGLLHLTIVVALVLHVAGGLVGLVAGSVAAVARKGARLHRAAGDVFVAAMLEMAVFAGYLGAVVPGQRVNVFIAVLTGYLVATGWLTARGGQGAGGAPAMIGLCVAGVLCAPFAVLSVQLALGMQPLFDSAIPFRGPVLIAIYSFTAVLALTVIGDARVVLAGGIAGTPRIARHLWRMCLALALAFGSSFTNGFARLLPGPYHVPLGFFLPQFVPVGLLVFWLIRVRFGPHADRAAQRPRRLRES